MVATTWMQMTKAALLLICGTAMSIGVLAHVHFDPGRLFAEATTIHPLGRAILSPGGLFTNPISTGSFPLRLIFGTAALRRADFERESFRSQLIRSETADIQPRFVNLAT